MTRLRGMLRLAWYRLTRRWPRYGYLPGDGWRLIPEWQQARFRALAASYRDRGDWAPDAGYARRRTP